MAGYWRVILRAPNHHKAIQRDVVADSDREAEEKVLKDHPGLTIKRVFCLNR